MESYIDKIIAMKNIKEIEPQPTINITPTDLYNISQYSFCDSTYKNNFVGRGWELSQTEGDYFYNGGNGTKVTNLSGKKILFYTYGNYSYPSGIGWAIYEDSEENVDYSVTLGQKDLVKKKVRTTPKGHKYLLCNGYYVYLSDIDIGTQSYNRIKNITPLVRNWNDDSINMLKIDCLVDYLLFDER